MMRTLLINPPYPFTECPNMPLGLSYIAAVLEENGVEVQVLDLLVSQYSEEKVRRCMSEFGPHLQTYSGCARASTRTLSR